MSTVTPNPHAQYDENEGFRASLLDALGLDMFTRKDQIIDEIKRLKRVEEKAIETVTIAERVGLIK